VPADDPVCLTCRLNRGELPAAGGVIYQHVEPVALVGWLVLKPLRHVEAFADLTPEEAAAFGPLTRRITRAMTEVLQPVKVYLSFYAEAAGFAHLHVHLIPRYAGTPPERRGPGIFEYLRDSKDGGPDRGAIEAAERAADAIRRALQDGIL
jgi:diadenosine tetraphosphate (Ap4A) HIT family hydrolase